MNGSRYYVVRTEGAKWGVSFGSALAIAISYTANHSILWAMHPRLAVRDLLRAVQVVAVKFATDHPYADPEKTVRRIIEIASTMESREPGKPPRNYPTCWSLSGCLCRGPLMNYILVVLSLLVGGSSLALAQTAGGSSGGGSAASGSAVTGSSGYAGGTLSTGHAISGTAGSSDPTLGNALGQAATGDPPDASSVTQPPTSHDNAVDTPAAKDATNSLSNTDPGVLKK